MPSPSICTVGVRKVPMVLAVGADDVGVLVVDDDGLLPVLADHMDVAALALDVDALAVGAGLDEDDPRAAWRDRSASAPS